MKKISKLFVLPLFALSLFSCSNSSIDDVETRDYSDYVEFNSKVEDLYNHEGRYAFYVYQINCSHCVNIKGKLFDYLDSFKAGNKTYFTNFYLCSLSPYSSEEGIKERESFKEKPNEYVSDDLIDEMIKAQPTSIAETFFFGTPSLYIIENKQFKTMRLGDTTIANYLATH